MPDSALKPSYNLSKKNLLLPWILKFIVDNRYGKWYTPPPAIGPWHKYIKTGKDVMDLLYVYKGTLFLQGCTFTTDSIYILVLCTCA